MSVPSRRLILLSCLILLITLPVTSSAAQPDKPYSTVNSTADTDDGTCDATDCTLREAMNVANASDDTLIAFDIPGTGVHSIQPLRSLPPTLRPLVIDGTTQPGYEDVPLIELDGSQTPQALLTNGLWIRGGNSTIKGLIINNFTFSGILLENGGGNTVLSNYIGTDSSGTQARGNRDGVYIYNSTDNIIGEGNLISGNNDDGVNFAGTSGGSDNLVQNNLIGTDVTGTLPLGNHGDGIKISEHSSDNVMAWNVIAFNQGRGVYAEVKTVFPTGNAIFGSQIFSNDGLGIDLAGDGITANDTGDEDSGANNLQNFPVLTLASLTVDGLSIEGTLNSTPDESFHLEFFVSSECDSSINGEGEIYLGSIPVITDDSGNTSFVKQFEEILQNPAFVTATATDSDNNTSEFSACLVVQDRS